MKPERDAQQRSRQAQTLKVLAGHLPVSPSQGGGIGKVIVLQLPKEGGYVGGPFAGGLHMQFHKPLSFLVEIDCDLPHMWASDGIGRDRQSAIGPAPFDSLAMNFSRSRSASATADSVAIQ